MSALSCVDAHDIKEVQFSFSRLSWFAGVEKSDTSVFPFQEIYLDSVKYKAVPVWLLVSDKSLTYSAPDGHPVRVVYAFSMQREEKIYVGAKAYVTNVSKNQKSVDLEVTPVPIYDYHTAHEFYALKDLQRLPDDLIVIQEIKRL